MKRLLIAVEGAHDQAFVEKCLSTFCGFEKIPNCDPGAPQNANLFEVWEEDYSFWFSCFPCKYPSKGGKIYDKLPFTSILRRDDISVGVYPAGGSKLISKFPDKLQDLLNRDNVFDAVGVLVDADKRAPSVIQQEICKAYEFLTKGRTSHFDVYVFPDNQQQGVLDTLLCQCGKIVYEPLITESELFLKKVQGLKKNIRDWKGFVNYDYEKALVASAVSVLKPGKTNTTSIADNLWISQKTKEKLSDVLSFLEQLIREAGSAD